jgi:3-aminobutyryl-CoA ammonia-lyase
MVDVQSYSLRTYLGQEEAHYPDSLVAGAHVLRLFGDAGTGLMLQHDGVEGLLAAYHDVQFRAPVYAGQVVDVTAEIVEVGNSSRKVRFVASVDGDVVCEALATVVARAIPPRPGH